LEAKVKAEIEKLFDNPYCPKDFAAKYRKLFEASGTLKVIDQHCEELEMLKSVPTSTPLTNLTRLDSSRHCADGVDYHSD
jgi:hypothetical protein